MKNILTKLSLALLLSLGAGCGDSNTAQSTSGSDGSTAATTGNSDVAVESITLKNEAGDTVTGFKSAEMVQKASVKLTKMGKNKVKGIFTAIGSGGEADITIVEKEIELGGILNTADLTVTLQNPFPVGDYKLDVYLNDKLAKTLNYKVEQ